MRNHIRRFLALFIRTDGIAKQQRNDVAVFPEWSNVLMGCCDCGLMHRYDFFIGENGELCVRGRRDHVATMAVRRDREFPFKAVQ